MGDDRRGRGAGDEARGGNQGHLAERFALERGEASGETRAADQPADEDATAPILKEAADRIGQKRTALAEGALILRIAGDEARPRRAAPGLAEHGGGGGGDALDRRRHCASLVDVDARREIFGHDSP
jgi:hypothetical protein